MGERGYFPPGLHVGRRTCLSPRGGPARRHLSTLSAGGGVRCLPVKREREGGARGRRKRAGRGTARVDPEGARRAAPQDIENPPYQLCRHPSLEWAARAGGARGRRERAARAGGVNGRHERAARAGGAAPASAHCPLNEGFFTPPVLIKECCPVLTPRASSPKRRSASRAACLTQAGGARGRREWAALAGGAGGRRKRAARAGGARGWRKVMAALCLRHVRRHTKTAQYQ